MLSFLQCQICGKVFTSSQFHPYSRHMATHESEGNEVSPNKIIRTRNLTDVEGLKEAEFVGLKVVDNFFRRAVIWPTYK